jgi:hypothetical protein
VTRAAEGRGQLEPRIFDRCVTLGFWKQSGAKREARAEEIHFLLGHRRIGSRTRPGTTRRRIRAAVEGQKDRGLGNRRDSENYGAAAARRTAMSALSERLRERERERAIAGRAELVAGG